MTTKSEPESDTAQFVAETAALFSPEKPTVRKYIVTETYDSKPRPRIYKESVPMTDFQNALLWMFRVVVDPVVRRKMYEAASEVVVNDICDAAKTILGADYDTEQLREEVRRSIMGRIESK